MKVFVEVVVVRESVEFERRIVEKEYERRKREVEIERIRE